MRLIHAILVDAEVIPCDIETWVAHNSEGNWRIASTEVGDARVNTVFLGLNHELSDPPLWFETACFGGTAPFDALYCQTVDEALAQHERMVALVSAR